MVMLEINFSKKKKKMKRAFKEFKILRPRPSDSS